jgi:hypothetical protein
MSLHTLTLILGRLSTSELAAASRVSTQWHAAASSPLTFRHATRVRVCRTEIRSSSAVRLNNTYELAHAARSRVFRNAPIAEIRLYSLGVAHPLTHLRQMARIHTLTIATGPFGVEDVRAAFGALKHLQHLILADARAMRACLPVCPRTVPFIDVPAGVHRASEQIATIDVFYPLREFTHLRALRVDCDNAPLDADLTTRLREVSTTCLPDAALLEAASFRLVVNARVVQSPRFGDTLHWMTRGGFVDLATRCADTPVAWMRALELHRHEPTIETHATSLRALFRQVPHLTELSVLFPVPGADDTTAAAAAAAAAPPSVWWNEVERSTPLARLYMQTTAMKTSAPNASRTWLRYSGAAFGRLTHLTFAAHATTDADWTDAFRAWPLLVYLRADGLHLTTCAAFAHLPRLRALHGVVRTVEIDDDVCGNLGTTVAQIPCARAAAAACFPSLRRLTLMPVSCVARTNTPIRRRPCDPDADLVAFLEALRPRHLCVIGAVRQYRSVHDARSCVVSCTPPASLSASLSSLHYEPRRDAYLMVKSVHVADDDDGGDDDSDSDAVVVVTRESVVQYDSIMCIDAMRACRATSSLELRIASGL